MIEEVNITCECVKQLVVSIDAVKAAVYSVGGSLWFIAMLHAAMY